MDDFPVILITGASSGIGEATALRFARENYRMVLSARRYERLLALSQKIQAMGGSALPVEADLTRLEDIQNLYLQAIRAYGQIDILFNNAGFGRLSWLEQLDPLQDIEAQIRVNLLAVIQLSRIALPGMIERHRGHIINMASVAGLVATPTYSIYAASKFGLRGFSEALRREVGVFGVHVSVIYPGGVDTEFRTHARINRKTGLTTPKRIRLEAGQVAEMVWRVTLRPRHTVVMPPVYHLAFAMNTIAPGLVDWFINKRFVEIERGIKR